VRRGVALAEALLAAKNEPRALTVSSLVGRGVILAETILVSDKLTGLYNKMYIHLCLRRECKRAASSGQPVSLMFVDLDDFETASFADGSPGADRILVDAAKVIRSSALTTHCVARLEGEQFAVLMPDTTVEGAVVVGERIRSRMAAYGFHGEEGTRISLTASVGVASLPDMGTSPDQLIRAAEDAINAAKKAGRNRVRSARPRR